MTMLLQGNSHNKDMKMVNRPSHGNLEDVVLCGNPHFLQWGCTLGIRIATNRHGICQPPG
jgi:hypothetical protein